LPSLQPDLWSHQRRWEPQFSLGRWRETWLQVCINEFNKCECLRRVSRACEIGLGAKMRHRMAMTGAVVGACQLSPGQIPIEASGLVSLAGLQMRLRGHVRDDLAIPRYLAD